MKPQLFVVTLGAVAGIFGARYFEVGVLGMFGLVIVGMFAALFLYRLFAKRSSV
ncbi:MAG: hypothetical protein HY562_02160 [Ignavibacteriales bacterium]|nr:hypothetical protein [Ignavibacteriales bacterium]